MVQFNHILFSVTELNYILNKILVLFNLFIHKRIQLFMGILKYLLFQEFLLYSGYVLLIKKSVTILFVNHVT